MRNFIGNAVEGFFGSFLLAGALIAALATGLWRVMSRLFNAFVHEQPLLIAPGKQFPTRRKSRTQTC